MDVAELRQTSLGMDDLIKELKAPVRSYPTCLIINEIGMICLSGEDKEGKGKEVLLSLLDHADWMCRFSAFCVVSCVPGLAQEKASVLETFKGNSDNQHFLERADESIKEFKDQFGL